MKDEKGVYLDFDEYLKEQEKKLNSIYKELLNNSQDKNAIKKFDRIVKYNIDYKGLIPCSKSYEGESLLTLSKTWMILILIKITKGKAQQEQFLTLVNSSLTHELNEYNEYREFFDEKCEILFSEEEAINQINLNPRLPKKISNNIEHEELKNYYIYLLFKPQYFQKVDLDEFSKIKKVDKKFEKSKSKNKKSDRSKTTNSIKLDSGTDSDEDDDKGDRLNEKDMISKNRTKQTSYKVGAKNNKNSISNKKQKNKKETVLEGDEDYDKINEILNKKGKSGNKKEEAKKGKKQNKKSSAKEKINDITDESSSENEDIDMDESKENKKNKKTNIKDKKNKYNKKSNKKFEEIEDSEEEFEKQKKKNKNKKEKEKKSGNKKTEKEKKNKRTEKTKNKLSSEKIFDILGIELIENGEEDEKEEKTKKKVQKSEKNAKKRKTKSAPPKNLKEKTKDTSKNKDEDSKNKKDKKEKKEKIKNQDKSEKTKKKKIKKSKTDDEDLLSEDDLINSLSQLNDSLESDSYNDNLENFNFDGPEDMEKQINAVLEGKIEEMDLESILADSKMEGIDLSQLDSKSKSEIDLESIKED